MENRIPSDQITSTVLSFIKSATKSIDIFCNAYVEFAGPISGLELKTILGNIRQEIPIRLLLGVAEDPIEAPSEYLEKSAQVLTDVLSISKFRGGIKMLTSEYWHGGHFILVDYKIALRTSMPIFGIFDTEWSVYITDEKESLDQIKHAFDGWYIDWSEVLYPKSAEQIITWDDLITVSNIDWDGILRTLTQSNDALYLMPPRKFEEFIAELLDRNGLDVHLTPTSKDGGRDILACSPGVAGDLLYLVECKRYRMDRPVGVSLVRGLYGVVEQEKATAGILFTTSTFTRGAVEFQGLVRHRLTLHDYKSTIDWVLKTINPTHRTN